MKKIIKSLCVLLCFAMLLISVSSCALLDGSAVGGQKNNNKTPSVRIVYPDSEEVVELKYNETTDITPKYIENKVLLGFYAQNEPVGYEYFNYLGKMNGVWLEEYPDTVYAIFEDIDYSKTLKSGISFDESPKRFYCAGLTVNFKNISDDGIFYPIIYCNPNLDVVITIHADIKQNGKYASMTTVKFGMGSETFKTEDFSSNASTYTHISSSHTIKAKQLMSSALFVNFDWHDGSVDSYGLVKNLYYVVSIVEPAE